MYLFVIDHPYHYEAENLCRVFFPFDRVVTLHDPAEAQAPQSRTVYTAVEDGVCVVRIRDEDGETARTAPQGEEGEYSLMALLFGALRDHTGKTPRWGMLTGIHPIKLLRQLTERFGAAEAERLFREKYFVSAEKAALAARTLRSQAPVTADVGENDYALYISVHFCPTRCA